MYRRGIVSAVDAKTHRVRVTLPERQNVETGWLEVLVRSSLLDREYGLPPVNSQVAVMLDERDESGCVLGAVYSSADPPPAESDTVRAFEFRDGTRIQYDSASHVLSVALGDGATIQLGGNTYKAAIAELVKEHFDAVKDELKNHTHQAGMLVAPPGTAGGPVTGTTGGAVAITFSPGNVGSSKVKLTD